MARLSAAARSACGKSSVPIAQIGKARLEMKRHRVIDLAADAAGGEVLPESIAFAHADHELVEDVPPSGRFDRQAYTIEQAARRGTTRA